MQDNDPVNDTGCKAASDADLSVRAAHLRVFWTEARGAFRASARDFLENDLG